MAPSDKENKEIVPEDQVYLVRAFLENQSKELELRSQELELDKQRAQYDFEYSKFSIGEQVKDLTNAREHHRKTLEIVLKYALGGAFFVTVIVCYALYVGREQFVLEIIKALAFGGCGVLAGSAYQKNKK